MATPFECDYALQQVDLVESSMCIVVIVNEFVTHVSNTADGKKNINHEGTNISDNIA